ncbi:putative cytochrome P450 oxidoreductase [Aspergillus carlsbadensis]|nr:putative cytochrome P450 oxidoreductase [Aspergillus carlsbadensis]
MAFWYAIIVLAVVAFARVVLVTTRSKRMPPGPPCLPVLGNLHQFPLRDFHRKFQQWADTYGPITCLKTGSQTLMLLNEPRVVRDLIEKRGAAYAARPDWFIRHFNGNLNIAFRDNDDVWRRMRKMYHVRLNVTVSNRYIPYQTFDSLQLLNDMLDSPENFSLHIQRFTTSVASTVLYGWRTASAEQGYVKDLIEWMDKTSEVANLQLADFYHFLRPLYRLLPTALSPYKQKLATVREIENRLFYRLMEDAKAKIAAGKTYPSFIRDMLLSKASGDDHDEDRLSEVEIAQQAGHGFGAASDTQWNSMLGLIKAMVLYPEAQAAAHAEIDRVVGPDRMPVWEDRANLPHVRAVIEEALRWMPTTLSAAVPHSLKRDDEYNGWAIPANSVIMMNVWALNNHVAKDGRPREFDPSRHAATSTLNENYGIDADSSKRPHFTFGAGRRVCPGFHVAQRGLFIATARLLWAFRFERALDETGRPVPIERDAVTAGLIVRPVAFPCVITPRSDGRVSKIREEWNKAAASLDAEGNYSENFFAKMVV